MLNWYIFSLFVLGFEFADGNVSSVIWMHINFYKSYLEIDLQGYLNMCLEPRWSIKVPYLIKAFGLGCCVGCM